MVKHSKERRRRGRFFVFYRIALIVLICGTLYAAKYYFDIPHVRALEEPVQVNSPYSDGDWCLVLVNRWNPMGDTGEIELTELSNGEKVDARIYPYLQKMFDDMRSEGIYPVVASGYRTEEAQQQIYDDKLAEYLAQGLSEDRAREETERWVALPGTSEHQLGLGIDINADGIHSYGYEVYEWLAKNAYRYGFIHRYPKNKTEVTGIANEPWHYRYAGEKAASEIYSRGICLEEYKDCWKWFNSLYMT